MSWAKATDAFLEYPGLGFFNVYFLLDFIGGHDTILGYHY